MPFWAIHVFSGAVVGGNSAQQRPVSLGGGAEVYRGS